MAEAVFRSLTKSNPRVGEVDSAGTGAYYAQAPPDDRTLETLRRHNVTDYDHGARKVRPGDFDTFDYIFAMDAYNFSDLQRLQRRLDSKGKQTKANVMMFGHFNGEIRGEEVIDPYYGADKGFEEVYQQVARFSKNFLGRVVDKDVKK